MTRQDHITTAPDVLAAAERDARSVARESAESTDPGVPSHHTCRMRIGTRLLWLLCFVVCAAPAGSQATQLRRVPTHELLIPLPGVAVIRDSVAWERLWRRYEERAHNDSGVVHAAVPAIDFRTEMLVAVALGPSSGCSNEAHYISQIVEHPDSIVIVLGSADEGGPQLTCMMIIEPMDVVRLGSSAKPVAFHWYQAGVPTPPPATWWSQPSLAELDGMGKAERRVFMTALARDPATPLSTLAAIAGRLGMEDAETAKDLLRRPDVRASTEVLAALTRWDQWDGSVDQDAGDELFVRHGLVLADEPGTPSDVLGVLIERLRGHWTPHHQEVARLLLQHPTVRGDQDLLRRFIDLTQQRSDLSTEACELYLARWSPWERTTSEDGTPTNHWYSRLACPDLPPPPRG